jgi:Zn-dependent protease with chaperone function
MIEGKWYAEGSAASYVARLIIINDTEYRVTVANGDTYQGQVKKLKIGNRLGNVERKIILEDGSLFATRNNDAVDETFKKQLKTNSFIHTLESKYRWVFVALIVTVLTAFAFFKWGIPWTSKQIAHALPEKTNQLIAANTLDFLDKYMFKKTTVSADKMDKIRKHFQSKVAPLSTENKEIVYKLHFRSWSDGNVSIPNALALPSGDIILTDKFVDLCENQEEMDSVLLHEMGHVVHRHTLEMVIEGTFVSVATMLIVGDSNGFADMGVGLGSLLVSSSYSRGHEAEADMYAFTHMLSAHIDPASFSHIMNRMTAYMEAETGSQKKESRKQHTEVKESKDSFLDYLSSHPNTQKRIDIANQFSKCYKKGLTTCDIKVSE